MERGREGKRHRDTGRQQTGQLANHTRLQITHLASRSSCKSGSLVVEWALEICGQLLSGIVSTVQCGSKSLDAESALPESMTVNYDEAVRKTVRCLANSSHSLLRLCRSTSMSMQIQFEFQTLEIRNEKLIESQRVNRFRVFRTLNFRSLNPTELLG